MLRARTGLVYARLLKSTRLSFCSFTTAEALDKYEHGVVEKKWQKYWEDNNIFETRRRKGAPKKYILDMFPYPSGICFCLISSCSRAINVRAQVLDCMWVILRDILPQIF